jgi:hypothetical protein
MYGDASVKQEIIVNSQKFAVLENLAAALKAIWVHLMPN